MHLLLQGLILASVSLVAANYKAVQKPLFEFNTQVLRKTNILNSDVDAAIDSILKDFNSPGEDGVAVVRKDGDDSDWEVETKGYGIAKADGTKATNETLFAIGSNSKARHSVPSVSSSLLINQSSCFISW
ncbi:hypothetical protein B0H19DRAFT_938196 [Mycena capillaripes]|nr:hypothetical protein B0H19DRAFT_938196 [Mycena capillaripes]